MMYKECLRFWRKIRENELKSKKKWNTRDFKQKSSPFHNIILRKYTLDIPYTNYNRTCDTCVWPMLLTQYMNYRTV